MRSLSLLILFLTLPLLNGCAIGVLAAGVGYAVSANKTANAKKEEVRVKYAEAYTQYRVEMEKVNTEREKAGLQPRPIMEYSDWMAQQPMEALREPNQPTPKTKEEKDDSNT